MGVLALLGIGFAYFISQQPARRPNSPRMQATEARLAEQKAERKLAATQQQDSADIQLIQQLLSEQLDKRSFSFATVVYAATGKQVLPLDQTQEAHLALFKAIKTVMKDVLLEHNQDSSPTRNLRRINEASRYFENSLISHLDALDDFSCAPPTLLSGKTNRSGYPDLRLVHIPSGTVAYLDPKLLEEGSLTSTLRTFYYSPKKRTNKINDDAIHLLIGIEHDGNDGRWKFTHWNLVDLYKLKVRLKAEFQSSNSDVYSPDTLIR